MKEIVPKERRRRRNIRR